MINQNKNINGKKTGLAVGRADSFNDDMMFNREDGVLFEKISNYMRAKHDLDEVRMDPSLDTTRAAVKEMITDYKNTVNYNKTNREGSSFIKDAFSGSDCEKKAIIEINEIKRDSSMSGVNDLTAEWVREWHTKKQSLGVADPGTKERNDFITESLKSEITVPEEKFADKKVFLKSRFFRYASLSAAVILGAMFIIKSLLPSDDAAKLFTSYYKPFDAVSPVTRGLNSDEAASYASAIASYKSGNYESAETLFSESVLKNPSFGSPRFFLGLSEIALGKYDMAVSQLNAEVNASGEYGKEAQWYLGLVYLKTGNNLKASQCFETLSHSAGFYRDRSAEILRRLK